jgi:hypothetical protein
MGISCPKNSVSDNFPYATILFSTSLKTGLEPRYNRKRITQVKMSTIRTQELSSSILGLFTDHLTRVSSSFPLFILVNAT